MPDEEEVEATVPVEGEPESPTGVLDDAAETDAEVVDEKPEPGPVPYSRFSEVNSKAKVYEQALKAAGYELDETTGQPVKMAEGAVDAPEPDIPAFRAGELPPTPKQWTSEQWVNYAEYLGYDTESLTRNDWAGIQLRADGEYREYVSATQSAKQAESAARTELRATLATLDDDVQLQYSEGARKFVRDEARKLSELLKSGEYDAAIRAGGFAGHADYIAKTLPRIKNDAIAQNLAEIVQTAAAKGADVGQMRTKKLGVASPPGNTRQDTTPVTLTPEQEAAAKRFKMTPAEYVAAYEED